MDPFALPCHPDLQLSPDDRDWRAIGVKSADAVLRKQTRCPICKTVYLAFQRTFPAGTTVEWVRPTPFRVTAAPVDGAPLWQDATAGSGSGVDLPDEEGRREQLAAMQTAVSGLGPTWDRSVQLCTPSYALMAGAELVAERGELLLERREKWNAQDRRLALLWSLRLARPVVAWHGFSRLLQQDL